MTKQKMKPEPAKTSLSLESHQVLLRPLVTEKGMHRSERYNQYSFEINVLATKEDVRRAVELVLCTARLPFGAGCGTQLVERYPKERLVCCERLSGACSVSSKLHLHRVMRSTRRSDLHNERV